MGTSLPAERLESPSSAPARWAPASRRSPRCAGHRVQLHDTRFGAGDAAKKGIADDARQAGRRRDKCAQTEADAAHRARCTTRGDAARRVHRGIGGRGDRRGTRDAKRELFARLENVVAPECIIATNTSSLSITALAAGMKHPGRVVGMHFFNPAPLMPLVEVVQRPRNVAEAAAATVFATAAAWGKTPVHASSTPGFIVNRCARPFYGEALRLLAEGAADPGHARRGRCATAGGFRMGPFELMDLIGLDVNFAVTRSVWEAYFHDPRYAPSVRAAGAGRRGLSRPQVRPRLLRLRRRRHAAGARDAKSTSTLPARVAVHGELGLAAPLADAHRRRGHRRRTGARRFAVSGRRASCGRRRWRRPGSR